MIFSQAVSGIHHAYTRKKQQQRRAEIFLSYREGTERVYRDGSIIQVNASGGWRIVSG
jgi:hypothetical protein